VGQDKIPKFWESVSVHHEGPAHVAPSDTLVARYVVSLERISPTRTEHVREVLGGMYPQSPSGGEAFPALAALEVALLSTGVVDFSLCLLSDPILTICQYLGE